MSDQFQIAYEAIIYFSMIDEDFDFLIDKMKNHYDSNSMLDRWKGNINRRSFSGEVRYSATFREIDLCILKAMEFAQEGKAKIIYRRFSNILHEVNNSSREITHLCMLRYG